MSYKKVLKTLKKYDKIDLMKAPVELSIDTSNKLGEDFKGVSPPEYVKGHAGSYETKDGMYHHVIDKKFGGVSHYLSTSKDPWDEKSQVAKIEGSPSSGSYTIMHSSVRPEHKGKGYGKKLYMSTLAHHGDMQSDNALTQRSHNAWKSLKDQTKGVADVSLANMGEKGTRHRAVGDKTKLQKMLHKRRIAPNKPSKLAASEQDVLFKNEDLKNPPSQVNLNPEHGKTIASAYEQMKHEPSHPEVQKAYGSLINETKKQFQDMVNSGVKMSRIQPGQENPYKNSKELHHDIRENNHIHFFPTDQGFGSDESDKSDHPMMQGTGVMHDGKELLANDMFRIVHDYYGHHKGGESGFGPKGEHRAYLTHKKMFSPEAQKALATETLGQNSHVNFGPHGEHNRANPHKTIYAEQKAGLLPDHIISGNWHSSENDIKKSMFDSKHYKDPVFNDEHVSQHLDKIDLYGSAPDRFKEEIKQYPKWKKIKVPIDNIHNHAQHTSLPMEGGQFGESDEEIAHEYAEEAGHKFPAIILKPHPNGQGLYQTLDGAHRTRAAHIRGDSHIEAYVPHEEE